MPLILPTAHVLSDGGRIFSLFRSKMASRCLQDAFKMQSFFHSFFDIVFYRFLSQLGPNLAPTWPPNPSQNPPKSHQKSIPNRILFLICFLIDFCIDFLLILDAKINQKSIRNQSENHFKSTSTKN